MNATLSNIFFNFLIVTFMSLCFILSVQAMGTDYCDAEVINEGEFGNLIVPPGSYCILESENVHVKGNFYADQLGLGVIIAGAVRIDGNVTISNSQPGSIIVIADYPQLGGNLNIIDNNTNVIVVEQKPTNPDSSVPPLNIAKNMNILRNDVVEIIIIEARDCTPGEFCAPQGLIPDMKVESNINIKGNTVSAGIILLQNLSHVGGNVVLEKNNSFFNGVFGVALDGNLSCSSNTPSVLYDGNTVGGKIDCE